MGREPAAAAGTISVMEPRSRAARRAALCVSALTLTLGVGGCADDPDPVYLPPLGSEEATAPLYDPTAEPAEAVMALVPADATELQVTDVDQLRDQFRAVDLTSDSSEASRARFDARVGSSSVALGPSVLDPVDSRLTGRFGFGVDDVRWEADFSGPAGDGWVVALGSTVSLAGVQRAIDQEVGPLAGAELDTATRLVSRGATDRPTESWAADPDLVDLVGQQATSTYVQRGCLDDETAFGPTTRDRIAARTAHASNLLDPVEDFSVALGPELATVHLGPGRTDVFERARIAAGRSTLSIDFTDALVRPVADPQGGRIGFTVRDPVRAVRLVEQRTMPFAVCSD